MRPKAEHIDELGVNRKFGGESISAWEDNEAGAICGRFCLAIWRERLCCGVFCSEVVPRLGNNVAAFRENHIRIPLVALNEVVFHRECHRAARASHAAMRPLHLHHEAHLCQITREGGKRRRDRLRGQAELENIVGRNPVAHLAPGSISCHHRSRVILRALDRQPPRGSIRKFPHYAALREPHLHRKGIAPPRRQRLHSATRVVAHHKSIQIDRNAHFLFSPRVNPEPSRAVRRRQVRLDRHIARTLAAYAGVVARALETHPQPRLGISERCPGLQPCGHLPSSTIRRRKRVHTGI